MRSTDDGSLLMAVLDAPSAETLSGLMADWYRALRCDKELVSVIGFFMDAGDWERARESLARAYGRSGGFHRSKFNVLLAASQSMKLHNHRKGSLRALTTAIRL